MGDFFTSPQQRAAQNFYDQAIGGKTPFDAGIEKRAGLAKTGLEQTGARMNATNAGNILSQLSSEGIAPGSSAGAGLTTKSNVGVAENVIQGEGQIDQQALNEQLQALSNFLNIGYSGLSDSSTFGDILAGLQTGGNLFSGVARGLGSQGLNLFGQGSQFSGGRGKPVQDGGGLT